MAPQGWAKTVIVLGFDLLQSVWNDPRDICGKDLICKNCNSFSDCVRQPRTEQLFDSSAAALER